MVSVTHQNPTATPRLSLRASAKAAGDAAQALAIADTANKDRALHEMIALLDQQRDRIRRANEQDMAAAKRNGLCGPMVARLIFDNARIDARIAALRDIAALPDPVGQPVEAWRTTNGLSVQRVRSPIGVILMIYEARPHVTVNAAALCLKAGNAALLRGGSEAAGTNQALGELWAQALERAGLPTNAVQVIRCSRDGVGELLKMSDRIDLVIPRGGKGLIRAVAEQSRIPVLKHEDGICHVYLDHPCDLDAGIAVVLDSKCLMPAVCNAAETLLVHAGHQNNLPRIVAALRRQGVEVRGCERTCRAVIDVTPAADEDWDTEYLDLTISIRMVDDVDEAIAHIHAHGSRHTDSIVTDSVAAARRFTTRLDSAVTLVNASTMFDDGKTLGMGAEIGIATGKLHARGPMGLRELTIPRLVIEGGGQVMERKYLDSTQPDEEESD